MRKSIAVFLLVIFQTLLWGNIVCAATIQKSSAASGSTAYRTYNLNIFSDDVKLPNPINKNSYWFEYKDGMALRDNIMLDLWYSYSNTILPDSSTITILVNDYPVASKTLGKDKKQPVNWRVRLPLAYFQKGYNEIRVDTSQRSLEGLCKDVDNASNWTVLHKETALHLELLPVEHRLADYPYPFIDYLNPSVVNSHWYLPAKPDAKEIEALLELAFNMGRVQQVGSLEKLKVTTGAPTQDDENQVLIGSDASILDASKMSLQKGQGAVCLTPLSQQYERISITGADGLGLVRAVRALAVPEYLTQTTDNQLQIGQDPRTRQANLPLGDGKTFTMADYGYSEAVLKGAFHHRTSFSINRPAGMKVGTGSYIELHFRHSLPLSAKKSAVTIYINGIPVNSAPLDAENAAKGVLRANIPASELVKPKWIFEFAFYHDLGVVDCSKLYDEVAWSVVEADTMIHLTTGSVGTSPVLDEFPYIGGIDLKGTRAVTVWLPQDPDEQQITLAAVTAMRMGQSSKAAVTWKVKRGEKISNDFQDSLIIIGYHNQLIDLPVMKLLPVEPLNDGKFRIDDGLAINQFGLDWRSILQVAFAAGKQRNLIYTFSAPDSQGMEQMVSLVNGVGAPDGLQGKVVLMDRVGQITFVGAIDNETSNAVAKSVLYGIDAAKIYLAVILFVLLISLITIVVVRRQ